MKQYTHELKTRPCYFSQTWDGLMPFQVRRAVDRDFQKGDAIVLREYVEDHDETHVYTGRAILGTVSTVCTYGQSGRFVVLGLVDLENRERYGVDCE